MTGYQPTGFDIDWTHDLIDKLRDGGTWAVPASGDIYIVHKSTKRLVRAHRGWAGEELHERNKVVWAEIGWTVEDSPSIERETKPEGYGAWRGFEAQTIDLSYLDEDDDEGKGRE